MRLRFVQWIGVVVAVLVLVGCGTTATTSGGASAPTGGGGSSPVPIEIPSASTMTIEDLPRATAPVVAGSSSNIAAAVTKASSSTNGLNIAEITTSSFSASSSAAGCYAAVSAQDVLSGAGSADYNLCVIQTAVGALSEAQLGFDLYDDVDDTTDDYTYRIVKLVWSGNTYTARLRVVRDTDVGITDFEYNLCAGSNQVRYSTQTISVNGDGLRALSARAILAGGQGDLINTDVTVTGVLNTDHKFVSKEVHEQYNLYAVSPDSWCDWTATQTTDDLTFNGACDDGASGASQQRFVFQLYDNNTSTAAASYTPKLLAIGDGGMVSTVGSGLSPQFNQAWTLSNSTLMPAASANSYLTTARAMTAATVPAEFTVGYTAAQTWNCSGTEEATITVDAGSLYDACGKYIDISPTDRPSCQGLDSTATP